MSYSINRMFSGLKYFWTTLKEVELIFNTIFWGLKFYNIIPGSHIWSHIWSHGHIYGLAYMVSYMVTWYHGHIYGLKYGHMVSYMVTITKQSRKLYRYGCNSISCCRDTSRTRFVLWNFTSSCPMISNTCIRNSLTQLHFWSTVHVSWAK